MSNTFWWKGNYGVSGETFANHLSEIIDAGHTANIDAIQWNKKENWFMQKSGQTGSTGTSSTGGFHFEPATEVPGAGANVFFGKVSNQYGITYEIPLSPCLVGGKWNGEWTGAGTGKTGGKALAITVKPEYGRQMNTVLYRAAADRVGATLWERAAGHGLVPLGVGRDVATLGSVNYGTGGDPLTGLKVDTEMFLDVPGAKHSTN